MLFVEDLLLVEGLVNADAEGVVSRQQSKFHLLRPPSRLVRWRYGRFGLNTEPQMAGCFFDGQPFVSWLEQARHQVLHEVAILTPGIRIKGISSFDYLIDGL